MNTEANRVDLMNGSGSGEQRSKRRFSPAVWFFSPFGVRRSAFSVKRSLFSTLPPSNLSPSRSRGSGLILTVLFVAAVGILFGLGRLAMYRDQCIRRFDRQREIERQLAVRSVLQFVQRELAKRQYESIRVATNTFNYVGNSGRQYKLTLRPSVPVFESDLKQGWVEIADDGSQVGVEIGRRSFSFDGTGTNGALCIVGREMSVSWLDYPWGLRYTVGPVRYGADTAGASPGTTVNLFIVGGSLPASGVSRKDLEDNPVIRVNDAYTHSIGEDFARLNVFYGEHGIDSIDDNAPLSPAIVEARFNQLFGIQLASISVALFEQGGPESAPTFSLGTLSPQAEEFFKTSPRLYVGAQQTDVTNVTYMVDLITVRPPYEWEVGIEWADRQGRTQEVATVVHAAGTKGKPTKTITYDSHGTQWRPRGR